MDNTIKDEGFGRWVFQTYQPKDGEQLGPYEGRLLVDSKLYIVQRNATSNGVPQAITIVAVPSQNVAYVTNTMRFQPE